MKTEEEYIEWAREAMKHADHCPLSLIRKVLDYHDVIVKREKSKAWVEGLETGFHSSFEGHNGEYWSDRYKDPLEDERKENPYD